MAIPAKNFIFHKIFSKDLKGFLESPGPYEANSTGTVTIKGWLFSKSSTVKALILTRDQGPDEEITYGIVRSDVAQLFPNFPQAAGSGFTGSFTIKSEGTTQINFKIWAVMEDDQRVCCFVRRLKLRVQAPPNFEGFWESPNFTEIAGSGALRIQGWLFSRRWPIKALILTRDQEPDEAIAYGIARPDVAQRFPETPQAAMSGFTGHTFIESGFSGKVTIKLWAVLEDGDRVCCLSRQVNIQPATSLEASRSKALNLHSLYLLLRTSAIKAGVAYREGRLPMSPVVWLRYLRRYYRQLQAQQTLAAEYSNLLHPWQVQDPYQRWRETNSLSSKLRSLMAESAQHLSTKGPKISLIVPVYNTPRQFLEEMIGSVTAQIYPNWELCLADDASSEPYIKEILEQAAQDDRVKVVFRPKNGRIIEATNSALDLATGEYVALLDHDDLLSSDALLHVAECISRNPDLDWIYTDEDKIDQTGRHSDPQMKGDWSPEMALTHNYTHHLTVIRKTLVEQVGRLRAGFEGAQDLDLFLRVSEHTTADKIHHLPYVCYHWRSHAGSTASHGTQKQYVFDSAYRAIEDMLQRRGLRAKPFLPTIAKQYGLCLHQLQWDNSLLAENPVTIVIPTRDKAELLKRCIASLEKTVDARFVKLLIVNDSSVESETYQYFDKLEKEQVLQCRVIHPKRQEDTFNYARLMNFAIEHIDTPYILHLNNDIEATAPGWLEDMVGWMSIEGVGVVGAKLLFPNQTIQHAGVVIGPHQGLADHLFYRLPHGEVGYICLPHAARNASAVTGACLLTPTSLYRELRGFDEKNFAVQYNDVDYCLRVTELGKRVVFTPQATLIHQESASRKKNYDYREHTNFLQKHRNFRDPFFSANLEINSMNMAVNPYHFGHVNRVTSLKVLIVTHNLNLEGAPLMLYEFAKYFATSGNLQVSILSAQDGPLRNDYEKLCIPIKILPEPFPIDGENANQLGSRLKKLGNDLQLASFDLVVCNTLLTFWGIELAKQFNLPSVWYIHESTSLKVFGAPFEASVQRLIHECFLNASRVVFVAEATRKIFHGFDKKDNFRVIPGGLYLEKIDAFRQSVNKAELRAKYKIDQSHTVITLVGTICERKGQHVFVEAIKELSTLDPEKFEHLSFVLVGGRKTGYLGAYLEFIQTQVRKKNLKNVHIYEETREVYDFFALSDIFVCASFEESFPRVLLEAMAFELKIVSTDVFGIPEMISDGYEGYLVEPGNPKALATTIQKCLTDVETSAQLASNAHAKVYRMFNNKVLLEKNLLLVKEASVSESLT